MKKIFLISSLIFLCSCLTSVEIFIIRDSIKNKTEEIGDIALLELASSDYNFRPSININADIPSMAASKFKLELKKRFQKKGRKIFPYPIQLEQCQTTASIIRKYLNNIYKINLSKEQKSIMKETSKIIGTKYLILLENIAMKSSDPSSPNSTFSLGASIQIWDLDKAELIFRGRNRVIQVSPQAENIKEVIDNKFESIFTELFAILP